MNRRSFKTSHPRSTDYERGLFLLSQFAYEAEEFWGDIPEYYGINRWEDIEEVLLNETETAELQKDFDCWKENYISAENRGKRIRKIFLSKPYSFDLEGHYQKGIRARHFLISLEYILREIPNIEQVLSTGDKLDDPLLCNLEDLSHCILCGEKLFGMFDGQTIRLTTYKGPCLS